MKSKHPEILFVGNAPYDNRGCEAIVRGTMEILRGQFGSALRIHAGVMAPPAAVAAQNDDETDPGIWSFPVSGAGRRGSLKWLAFQMNKHAGTSFIPHLWDLRPRIGGVRCALELGGDNYSLDYGMPDRFLEMDRLLLAKGIPVVLWGASVGPFEEAPAFAPRMFDHLRSLTAVFVREPASLEYLRAHGVSRNVHFVADPAFVMRECEPAAGRVGFAVAEGTVGVNLSPLVARFRDSASAPRDLGEWTEYCAGLVRTLAVLKRPILLVPHVESLRREYDDFAFLRSVHERVAGALPVPVNVVPRGLGAAELKWLIARCEVFVGARTHSTIAALSSLVPTLSIGYSMKATGLNRDVYGNLDHCLHVSDLTPGRLLEGVAELLRTREGLRTLLQARMVEIRARALSAGPLLAGLLAANPGVPSRRGAGTRVGQECR